VLIKGGHRKGPDCIDTLAANGSLDHFSQKRIDTPASHGTGCTLSAAITAAIAHQQPISNAVSIAKSYLCLTLRNSYTFQAPDGTNIHPLNQATSGSDFHRLDPLKNST
jgi:hydroxymethylpyrimidine/phosphomethylpyrimidine kinase